MQLKAGPIVNQFDCASVAETWVYLKPKMLQNQFEESRYMNSRGC